MSSIPSPRLAVPALAAILTLAFAAPAQATNEHTFDPVLSLRGNCSTSALDEVADPGLCPMPPGVAGVDHPPKAFEQPCGAATDSHGDLYVANAAAGNGGGKEGTIDVFDPQGHYLTEVKDPYSPCAIDVDSQGNLYVTETENGSPVPPEQGGRKIVRFNAPEKFPPAAGAVYGPRTIIVEIIPRGTGTDETEPRNAAVDPSNNHLYVSTKGYISEYGSAAEGNPLITEKIPYQGSTGVINVYGKTHQIYVASHRPGGDTTTPEDARVLVLNASGSAIECETDVEATPEGSFGWAFGTTSIAIDQSNGDVYVADIDASGHESVDQFNHNCEYLGQVKHSFKKVPVGEPGSGLAVDAPCLDGLGEVCGGKTYDSPNEGYLYVAQGRTAANYHLYAFAPVFKPKFKLTVAKMGTGQGTVTSTPAGISCGTECSALYEEGTKVTLKAKADEGSTFTGFSGACSGTGLCEVTMSEAKSVTAEFTKEETGPVFHKLTVSVTGNGSVSANTGTITGCTSAGGPTCEGEYEQGDHVTLTETPGEGSLFNGWQTLQCDESTATTCEVTIGSGDEGVAASFVAAQTLKVTTEGPGTITSSPGLISCSPFCEDSFPQGTKVTLTATPAPGAIFIAWKHCDSGGVIGGHCTVTMDKAKAVTAVFASGHALTVKSSGLGKVQSSPAGISCLYGCLSTTAAYNATTKVTLKATPARHFHFAGFSGDCSGTGPCEVSMGADREVKALFVRNTAYSLTLTRTGAGKGIVKSHPAGISCGFTCISVTASYDEGEEVLLEVSKVALGSTFGGWSGGGCSGTAPTCTVAMSEAKEVTAEFK